MARKADCLIPLQEVDQEIHRLRMQRQDKPRDLAGVEEKLRHAADNVQAMKEEIKQLRLEIQKREHMARDFDEKIAKLSAQSLQARKNDEYQAFLKEISGQKAEKERVEDALLDLMFQVDEKIKLEKLREEEVRKAEAEYAELKRKVEVEIADIDRRLSELEPRRREVLQAVDRELLTMYERILRAKEDGLAIVPVAKYEVVEDDGAKTYWGCGGCSVEVTKQMVNELRQGKDIVFCRSCSRILYWVDETAERPREVPTSRS